MDDREGSKPRAVGCVPTRDGRTHLTIQVAATLTKGKAAFSAASILLLLLFLLAPFLGLRDEDSALRARVVSLEDSLGRRMAWLAEHRKHLRVHLLRRSWADDGSSPSSSSVDGEGVLGGGEGEGEGFGADAADASSTNAEEEEEKAAEALSEAAEEFPPAFPPPDDGRRHLWTEPGELSRLAEAMVAEGLPLTLPRVAEDSYMCGSRRGSVTADTVSRKKLAIAAVTWRAPLSLRASMRTWQERGLLDVADERMLFVNSPTEEDLAIAREYEFDVWTTGERGGNIMAGPSLAYLAGNSSADYILFMEKDFALSAPDRRTVLAEMYAGVAALARGIDVYRLRGKTDFPAEGMPDCCAPTTGPPQCPYNSQWASSGYFSDHMNWLRIFCVDDPVKDGRGQVVKCTAKGPAAGAAGADGADGEEEEEEEGGGVEDGEDEVVEEAGPSDVDSYCFSGGSSNWSNNPVLFPRRWFNEHLRAVALEDECFEKNNLFEFKAMMAWLPMRPHVKVCVSMQGIFTHHEVDQ